MHAVAIEQVQVAHWLRSVRTVKSKKGVRHAGGGRKLAIGNDNEILKWIVQQRELHIPVSRQSIQDYAKRLCSETNPEFIASSGWLDKFMRRHQLISHVDVAKTAC